MSTKTNDSINAVYSSDDAAATNPARHVSDEALEVGAATKTIHSNLQDLLSFIAQADISKVTVETKDGKVIVASFPAQTTRPADSAYSSSINSLDVFKSIDSTTGGREESMETDLTEATLSLESLKDDTAASGPAAFNRTMSGGETSTGFNPFESKDWAAEYANTHVEVSYSSCFGDRSLPPAVGDFASSTSYQRVPRPPRYDALGGLGQVAAAVAASASTSGSTSLPPKKRAARDAAATDGAAKTDWTAMFNNALKPLVEAASLAQKEHPISVDDTFSGSRNNDSNMVSFPSVGASKSTGESSSSSVVGFQPKKKRKPRKIVPEVKMYVKFTDRDVLFGRGGRSNHHIGNKVYRDIVTAQQDRYRACDKHDKTRVAQAIVDRVHNEIGGRFLELDPTSGKWFLVPNVVARRKVGQALRENNTEAARAAKRAKYQGGKANKKQKPIPAIASESIGNRPTVAAQFV